MRVGGCGLGVRLRKRIRVLYIFISSVGSWGDGTKSNPKPRGSPFLISFLLGRVLWLVDECGGSLEGFKLCRTRGGKFFYLFRIISIFIVYKSWPGGMIKDILYPE